MKTLRPCQSKAAKSASLATTEASALVTPPLSTSEMLDALVCIKRDEFQSTYDRAAVALDNAVKAEADAWKAYGLECIARIDLSTATPLRRSSSCWTRPEGATDEVWTIRVCFTVATPHVDESNLPAYVLKAVYAMRDAKKGCEAAKHGVTRSNADIRREISAQMKAASGSASRVGSVVKDPTARAALQEVLAKLANVPSNAARAPLAIEANTGLAANLAATDV